VSINGGASGTGHGTVNITVAPNPGVSVRTGALTIAGLTVAVTEAAQPACSVTLSPSGAAFGKDAATGSFSVATPSYCQWTAVSGANWLTVTSGTAGGGNGTVAYTVQRHFGTTARSAAIGVNEKSFTLTQEGDVVVSCEYSVTPVEFTPCMSVSSNMTAIVTTQATCSWAASPAASWIDVIDGQSGTGPGVISFRVSDNWDAPRQGILEVRWPTVTAGQNLRVRQAGCSYGVSANNLNLPVGGGAANFEVVQQSDPYTCGGPLQNACLWTAVSTASWIIITTSMPQVGDNRVNFTVAPNNTGVSRTGAIVIRDKTVTLTQLSV